MFISALDGAHDELCLWSLAWPLHSSPLPRCRSVWSQDSSQVHFSFLGAFFVVHSSDLIVMSLTIVIFLALCHGQVLKIVGWSSKVDDV